MSARVKPEEQFARLMELSAPSGAASDPTMASMTGLAMALRSAGQSAALPSPDPAFRDALRQRLVAVASVQNEMPEANPARTRGLAAVSFRMQRRIAALGATVAVATSFAGVGVAAARSLPGDPFYGVKRATEAVQLWTARGDEAKGKRHLEFAQTRLAEAQKLSPTSSHLASTLASMDSETEQGTTELITAYKSSHSTAPLADLVTFTNDQVAGLSKLATTLPADLKAKETTSLNVLGGVATQVKKVAHGVCILCTPPTNGPTPAPIHSSQHPTTKPSGHPSQHPTTSPSKHPTSPPPSAHPSTHPSQGAGTSTHPTNHPTHPIIDPTAIISSILHPKHTPSPIPIVTKLLGKLGLGH